MSHLPLGGGSDERTEDTSLVCVGCGKLVRADDDAIGLVGVAHGWVHFDDWCIEAYHEWLLASQRAMDREAVQG